MNIGSIGPALSAVSASEPNTIAGAVSLKMLDKTLDTSEAMNAGLAKMIELSVNPNVGSNFDMYA